MRVRVIGVVCFVLAGWTVSFATAPPAAAATCANGGSTFAGRNNPPGSATWGSQAQILERYNSVFCSGQTHAFNPASHWVMFAGFSNAHPGAQGYAQIGVFQGSTDLPCVFAEYDKDTAVGSYTRQLRCDIALNLNDNSGWVYSNFFSSACACESMIVGYLSILQTNFSPLSQWTDGRDIWSGESYYPATSVPGVSSLPVTFVALSSQAPFATTFSAAPGPFNVSMPKHVNSVVGGIVFNGFSSYQN
jgi:hypothetical protein